VPNDYFVSLIRTWVPVAIGSLLTWLASTLGIVLSDDTSVQLTIAAVGIVTAVYYALARAVEKRWPGLGRILLALGLTSAKVAYQKPADVPPTSYRSRM
jgi:hypothetical protein